MNNRVTICMPAYNAEKYLKKTLNSICRQTYEKWDLVIVDDGSTDSTNRICSEFAKKDSRIHLMKQKNSGAPTARKTAVHSEIARQNEWLMFCDSDDIMPKDAVQKMVETAVSYDTDLVCGASKKMIRGICISGIKPIFASLDGPRKIEHDELISDIYASFFAMHNLPVSLWGKLYRYKYICTAIDSDNVVHFTGDDLVVTMQVIPEIRSMVLIPDVVYHYRIGGGSSRYSPTLLDDFVNLYRFRLPFIEKYPMKQNVKFYMDVELMYYSQTYLLQQVRKYGIDCIEEEITKLNAIPEIHKAASELSSVKHAVSAYAEMLYRKDVNGIKELISGMVKKGKKREFLKRILVR